MVVAARAAVRGAEEMAAEVTGVAMAEVVKEAAVRGAATAVAVTEAAKAADRTPRPHSSARPAAPS